MGKKILRIGTILAIAVALYLAAYFGSVDVSADSEYMVDILKRISDGRPLPPSKPGHMQVEWAITPDRAREVIPDFYDSEYSWGAPVTTILFHPAHLIDRMIRQGKWRVTP